MQERTCKLASLVLQLELDKRELQRKCELLARCAGGAAGAETASQVAGLRDELEAARRELVEQAALLAEVQKKLRLSAGKTGDEGIVYDRCRRRRLHSLGPDQEVPPPAGSARAGVLSRLRPQALREAPIDQENNGKT